MTMISSIMGMMMLMVTAAFVAVADTVTCGIQTAYPCSNLLSTHVPVVGAALANAIYNVGRKRLLRRIV